MGLGYSVVSNLTLLSGDTHYLEAYIMQMNMSGEEAENTVYKKENYKSEKSGTKRLLDLCTGSGIIAVTLKKAGGFDEVYASDISRQALDTAVKNARYNPPAVRADLLLLHARHE